VPDEMIRVLIVDDQRMFAESIKYIIESRASDIAIVGVALDGREAVRMVAEEKPDIVLMDVRMPVMDGVEAMRLIRQRHPDTGVIMLTTFDDDEYVKESLAYGAVGYLLKNMPPVELINAIRAVKGGIMQIDPSVSRALIKSAQTDAPDDAILANLKTLTRREREVLQLMVQAFDNRQISRTLNVSEQTVRNYISVIYSKLGVAHRMDVLKIVDKISSFLTGSEKDPRKQDK
jgi:DNA-binding NarL/FixJ family response regulator